MCFQIERAHCIEFIPHSVWKETLFQGASTWNVRTFGRKGRSQNLPERRKKPWEVLASQYQGGKLENKEAMPLKFQWKSFPTCNPIPRLSFKGTDNTKAFSDTRGLKNIYLSWTFSREAIAGWAPPNKCVKPKGKYEIWQTRDPTKERCRRNS